LLSIVRTPQEAFFDAMVAPSSLALAALLSLANAGLLTSASSESEATTTSSALHPMRFLDTATTTTPSSSLLTSSTIVIEPSRRFLTDFESTVRREVHGFKSTSSIDSISPANNYHHHLRSLQTQELTFDDVCSFLVDFINQGSEGAIVCSCDSVSNTLSCLTPAPICEDTFTNICASLALNITFLDNFGADKMGVCVNYTGVSDPSGPFRDGCVSADFADDGTTVDSCVAQFDDANGVRTNCTTCTGCGNVTTGAGFSLDCSNLYPGATTSGCYTTGGTAQQASALFPAAQEYTTNGTSSGGGGDGTFGNGTITDGGSNGGGSNGGSSGGGMDGGSNGGSGGGSNGTITDDDTAGDTEDDAKGNGDSGTATNGTGTTTGTVTNGTSTGSGSAANAAAGTSSGRRSTSGTSGTVVAAGIAAAVSSYLVGMLASP
jgi:hypothetical protein